MFLAFLTIYIFHSIVITDEFEGDGESAIEREREAGEGSFISTQQVSGCLHLLPCPVLCCVVLHCPALHCPVLSLFDSLTTVSVKPKGSVFEVRVFEVCVPVRGVCVEGQSEMRR